MTGPLIGRPKSATFRTLDIAGLDILARVTRDLGDRLNAGERRLFDLPPFVGRMIERGSLGEKTGQGFYKRVRAGEDTRILALDVGHLDATDADPYHDRRAPALPGLDAAAAIPDLPERIRALVHRPDKAGSLLRWALLPTLHYAARVAPEVAYSLDEVDRAMRWGFGWALGPLETLDAIGDAPAHYRTGPLSPMEPPFLILQSANAGGHCQEQPVGRSRRSRRRRTLHRVPFEDEHDRRRHHRDAARGRRRGRGQLPGAGHRHRSGACSPQARTSTCC